MYKQYNTNNFLGYYDLTGCQNHRNDMQGISFRYNYGMLALSQYNSYNYRVWCGIVAGPDIHIVPSKTLYKLPNCFRFRNLLFWQKYVRMYSETDHGSKLCYYKMRKLYLECI